MKYDDGSFSYYGHMNEQTHLKVGDRVECGDKIGRVGMAYLHFEWSGHDPYCEFRDMGYSVSILNNSGASCYLHDHSTFYYASANGTKGGLAINSRAQSGCQVGVIPDGAVCKVYPDRSYGNWLYVEYNGVKGFSYKMYLVNTAPASSDSASDNKYTAYVRGTVGALAINSRASSGYKIGVILEGVACTVYKSKSKGNWLWVEYGKTSGYAYSKYLKT